MFCDKRCGFARMVSFSILFFVCLSTKPSAVNGFVPNSQQGLTPTPTIQLQAQIDGSKEEAKRLLAKARELRSEIGDGITPKQSIEPASKQVSPWNVADNNDSSAGYRLYVDIGREEGTWMDPRWGASGRRIEFSLDLAFLLDKEASEAISANMVKDNFGGKSSTTKLLQTAPYARLRGGFDRMSCPDGGAYRIDVGRKGASTIRFFVPVDGTEKSATSYGDISVPKGCLYFSLPCFQGGVSQLSSKEGPVTVRQIGWNTGWRREESRIVGTFRAVPIDKAKGRDGF